MREEQACVWFDFGRNDRMKVQAEFLDVKLLDHPIEFAPEVQRIVEALAKIEID
jgi:hypothetical protein